MEYYVTDRGNVALKCAQINGISLVSGDSGQLALLRCAGWCSRLEKTFISNNKFILAMLMTLCQHPELIPANKGYSGKNTGR